MLSTDFFIAFRKSLLFQPRVVTPTESECGHNNAGQELCYLCHQRAARNIPVSFEDEKRRRELEEDKIIHDYQIMKNNEFILGEQVCWRMARSSFILIACMELLPLGQWCHNSNAGNTHQTWSHGWQSMMDEKSWVKISLSCCLDYIYWIVYCSCTHHCSWAAGNACVR